MKDTSFEGTHEAFRGAFPEGFPWELLEIVSGPTKVESSGHLEVVFSWRHWSKFVGSYNGNVGRGQQVDMFGLCRSKYRHEN